MGRTGFGDNPILGLWELCGVSRNAESAEPSEPPELVLLAEWTELVERTEPEALGEGEALRVG